MISFFWLAAAALAGALLRGCLIRLALAAVVTAAAAWWASQHRTLTHIIIAALGLLLWVTASFITARLNRDGDRR